MNHQEDGPHKIKKALSYQDKDKEKKRSSKSNTESKSTASSVLVQK